MPGWCPTRRNLGTSSNSASALYCVPSKRYLPGTGQLQRFRGEALQAGLKDRWAKKDYATIVALGRRLPTDYLVENTAIMHYVRNAAARAAK